MTVRTDVLLAHVGFAAGAGALIATVPAGERWIVKEIILSNYSGASVNFDLYATSSRFGATVDFLIETIANGVVKPFARWLVLDEGDTVHAIGPTTSVGTWWSGSRLVV